MRGALGRLNAGVKIDAPGQVAIADRERLQALGYVGAQAEVTKEPARTLTDPKDAYAILETYREAVELAVDRKWSQAIALLQQILRENPVMVDVWEQVAALAMRAERYDLSIDAYKHVIELEPAAPRGYLGAAAAMLKARKLDEARAQAEMAAGVAPERDIRSRVEAHELGARIALAHRDGEEARRQAELAHEADPTRPLPTYIEARLLYDQGKYEEALSLFEQASAELTRTHGQTVADLHFHTADALVRLGRDSEAEQEFADELKAFPQNTRARAGLATLYHANGQGEDAARVLEDLIRITPTPDTYALAARLWTTFGDRQQADAVRAQARRAFSDPAPSRRHAAR
jgi:tetratricopeptide (TPR) repeat protein